MVTIIYDNDNNRQHRQCCLILKKNASLGKTESQYFVMTSDLCHKSCSVILRFWTHGVALCIVHCILQISTLEVVV